MHDIQQLIAEHEKMDELAEELLTLVQSPDPWAGDAFALVRRLSACLDEHLAAENGILYADHYRAMPGRLESEVVAFERTFQDLSEEWSLYLREWTIDNIVADWRNFSHATQWLMTRLRERIAQENEILYPLALHHGLIRLRPEGWQGPEFDAAGANI
ncbi:MAG: hemerythrin domain-containing protein [Sphingobium sp.]